MEEILKARVVEIILDKYIVKLENNTYVEAILKGNIKKKNSVLVGDFVGVTFSYDKYLITEVLERKNSLIRPPVANIDQLVIVISLANPKPDYMLLDKQLILCKLRNIKPILCINKIDLSNDNKELEEELKKIKKVYSNLVDNIIYTSALKGSGLDKLKEVLLNNTSAFSGNSGVGKSSITSVLIENCNLNEEASIEIGEIGKKTKRGKHTTKYVKLYSLNENTYLLDTPGFSSYELYDIEYKKIKECYNDFLKYKCDYEDCNHVNESEEVCAVKKGVNAGDIDKERYERYVYIFSKLKELDDRKYK